MTAGTLACACGEVRGRLDGARQNGNLLVCYCKDCRAFARHLGAERMLDPRGGSTIYQTSLGRLSIDAGAEKLACLRLGPKGILRWYTACCGAPLGNTLNRPAPFLGLIAERLDEDAALGQLRGHVFGKDALAGEIPKQGCTLSLFTVMRRVVPMMMTGYLRGEHRRTALFGPEGKPVAVPHLLTQDERRHAYASSSA